MWYMPLKRHFPLLVHPVRWSRWVSMHALLPRVAWHIERKARGSVMAGPFKGLRLACWQRGDLTKLLGLYERCLQPTIERVIARKPRRVIDVGAEYGYYALGLTMRLPESEVIAYEIDPTRLSLLMRYRKLNKLDDRLVIRGGCTIETLAADTADSAGAFILMDIEGGEAELLDPVRVPGLRTAEILVELHEMFVPGVTDDLRQRFAATHDLKLIKMDSWRIDDIDAAKFGLENTNSRVLARLLDEGRGSDMSWLHMLPKAAV